MPQDAGQNTSQAPSEDLGISVAFNSLHSSFSDARGASREKLQLLKRRSEVGCLTRHLHRVCSSCKSWAARRAAKAARNAYNTATRIKCCRYAGQQEDLWAGRSTDGREG